MIVPGKGELGFNHCPTNWLPQRQDHLFLVAPGHPGTYTKSSMVLGLVLFSKHIIWDLLFYFVIYFVILCDILSYMLPFLNMPVFSI